MARLNGAVLFLRNAKYKIGFTYTAERLYHINGKPREEYVPNIKSSACSACCKKRTIFLLLQH